MKSVRLILFLWEEWGIHLLVTGSLACQITLAIFANHRKHTTSIIVRGVIFAAYFLSSSNAALALTKLIVLQTNGPERPDYVTQLKGLLAPLLLMLLGYPDSIAAYSFDDSRLSSRDVLNLLVSVGFVIWIMIRCWHSSSPVGFLYFPLFTAGIMRSAAMVWALLSVHGTLRSRISAKGIFHKEPVGEFFGSPNRTRWSREQQIILKAYHRFDCLKPHIVNWLYHPESLVESRLTVERNLAFITTEFELGFMYDVLYTKLPILFKPLSLICRFISFFCLVSALCGFAIIFKNAFLIDIYIAYTYAMLMGVTVLEGYQIVLQPFSAWAIVVISHHQRNRLWSTRLLKFLVERYMNRKRWSNSVGQLDLFDPRLYDEWTWSIGRILKHLGKKEMTWRRYRIHSRLMIPSSLKELLVEDMEKLNVIRGRKPFTEYGKRTLEAWKLSSDAGWTQEALEVLEGSISTTFDKSIIVWHMATKICLSEPDSSPNCKGSKLLSKYMMYLLALHPHVLSLLNTIELDCACDILKLFLRYRDRNEALRTLSSEETVLEPILDQKGTIINREWHPLLEAQKLAATLKGKDNKWQIVSSIWVEMLCYAAYNCQLHYHTELLRQGGELITHVWLLLMHHTDKYTQTPKNKPAEETKGKSQSEW
ncbi:hypothetical protein ACJRO7_015217 [Eucalyptus globulus]|uniref:DUF4220 domain-containing protein n=1 Tax=Eucalyptus globulus TaxID=34317 RepID=A0ABD3L8M7_EUCGL